VLLDRTDGEHELSGDCGVRPSPMTAWSSQSR
jgi:hypothetical protein